jgi:V-type H+-transporting ATPase subunit E
MQSQDSADLENFKIIRSIYKNTYDKMLEIKVQNRRSWNESKKSILEEEKKKIDKKYENDYNKQYVANKIEVSEARNNSNLNKMRKRSELMDLLKIETLDKLKVFANPENNGYRELIRKLILEGMVKLLEPVCVVQVRKKDEEFVKKLFPGLEKEYAEFMNKETKEDYKCTLELDTREYLRNESGGVLLRNKDKKITLINDLESRLNLAYEQLIPVVKNMLFSKNK